MTFPLLLGIVAAWMALIYFCGTARFGRNQTQRWIDALAQRPWGRRLAAHFDRHHGFFRASFHYVEFCTLATLGVGVTTHGTFRIATLWPFGAWAITLLIAYLDEWHQSRTPGRMFRRIDFMHSLLGASAAFLLILLLNLVA